MEGHAINWWPNKMLHICATKSIVEHQYVTYNCVVAWCYTYESVEEYNTYIKEHGIVGNKVEMYKK
jgi:hypothetical protein